MSFLSTPSARRATSSGSHCSSFRQYFYPRPPRGGRRLCAALPVHERDFYPRPPRGGRPCSCRRRVPPAGISIHALREEGDRYPCAGVRLHLISIHALREEGDASYECLKLLAETFLSTPSARRATHWSGQPALGPLDFYPRPPRGGRREFVFNYILNMLFLSTPSARRATLCPTPKSSRLSNFYPRPPRGGRPYSPDSIAAIFSISIHALREEGDAIIVSVGLILSNFYPRPPRGGRPTSCPSKSKTSGFLSTPSARRATPNSPAINETEIISIHALREEGDPRASFSRSFWI